MLYWLVASNSLENKETLDKLFEIFKKLILFNDGRLLNAILSEERLLKVIGVLEYDTDPRNKR